MKHLKDFKEEIHKCSKCGICQESCPIYKETGNDCSVSRGLFIMLDGVLKNKLNMSKKINSYLDTCLKCDKCKNVCPSNINVVKIITVAKYEYFKNSWRGKLYSFIESKFIFDNFLKIISKITNCFISKHTNKEIKNKKGKIIYFGGCIEKFRPDIKNYAISIMNHLGYEVIDINFNCCGIPFLTTGNLPRFEEVMNYNINQLKNIDFDYFVTDCASCEHTWREYSEFTENDNLKAILSKIKFKNIYEFIAESDLKFKIKNKKTVTYHKPCHEKSFDYIKAVLDKCENIDYKELENFDKCCGFAGLEHPWTLKTSGNIIIKKLQSIYKSKSDYILTSCVGCSLVIGLGTFIKKRTSRIISFLKKETEK
jgi:glycolate oxidase iron-sulfur subunit